MWFSLRSLSVAVFFLPLREHCASSSLPKIACFARKIVRFLSAVLLTSVGIFIEHLLHWPQLWSCILSPFEVNLLSISTSIYMHTCSDQQTVASPILQQWFASKIPIMILHICTCAPKTYQYLSQQLVWSPWVVSVF